MECKEKDNQHSSILSMIVSQGIMAKFLIHKCHRNKIGVLATNARDLGRGKALQLPCQQIERLTRSMHLCGVLSEIGVISIIISTQ